MSPVQQVLFDPAAPPGTLAAKTSRTALARQRWWRLKGHSLRLGRDLEPVLVTPALMARIETACCPVTREPLGSRGAQVVGLRDDAAVAAGHLATLSARAAACAARPWHEAWAIAQRATADPSAVVSAGGLSETEWRRLAVLKSFVQPLSPMQAGMLPLHVLPPPRLRVLSPVQALQVALTLALARPAAARQLSRLASLAAGSDLRDGLRVFVLTLSARCPVDRESTDTLCRRQALEDLWADPLLARRWQRLAGRLEDREAHRLLSLARQQQLLGNGWRLMDRDAAVDGWGLPESAHHRQVG